MSKARPVRANREWQTAKAAARISGLSPAMVNYLCHHEFVVPTGDKNRGYGVVRKYVYSDLVLLRVVAKLLDQGISVKKLGQALTALQKRGKRAAEALEKKYIVTDGDKMYFRDDEVLELLDSGQMAFAFVLELGLLRREVDTKIAGRRQAA